VRDNGTGHDLRRAIAKATGAMQRRVQMMVARCVLTLIDDSKGRQELQVSLLAGEAADGVEHFQSYGYSSVPFPDSEGVYLSIGGDRNNGVVIATGDRRYRLKNLLPGEVALYDDQGQTIHLTRDGIVIDGGTSQLPIKIQNTSSVTIDSPTAHMTGNLMVDGEVTAKGSHTVSAHTHGGVAIGGAHTTDPTG